MRTMLRSGTMASLVCLVFLAACSGPKATRVDYAGGWSIDCPAGFQYGFNNLSQGPHGELDLTSPPGSVHISVYGLNLPYSEVVDQANTQQGYMRGSLVTRGDTLAVLQFSVRDSRTGNLRQHTFVVRDLGQLRTGIVEGSVTDTGSSEQDILTDYCTRIANSMVATSAWVSDGKGGPGP